VAGYKEFDTKRTYMAKMGDWRQNKDEEVELDGIGGVNIVVKADVHRSGIWKSVISMISKLTCLQGSIFPVMRLKIKQKLKDSPRWQKEQDTKLLGYQTTSYGI
jgi:hypothetical protein